MLIFFWNSSEKVFCVSIDLLYACITASPTFISKNLLKQLCSKPVNSVNKWQGSAIHAYPALPGLEVQISNQQAENLTPHHSSPLCSPSTTRVFYTCKETRRFDIKHSTAGNRCSRQFRCDHADVPLHLTSARSKADRPEPLTMAVME